jgi:hypothetical protein
LFLQIAAVGTWMGDFLTAFMVTDAMLQNWRFYPHWLSSLRVWWTSAFGGNGRITVFWTSTLVLTCSMLIGLSTINYDNWNFSFYTNEVGRAWLAATITLFDLLIVVQDWEFPTFDSAFDIKLPGLSAAEIKFKPLGRFHDFFTMHITGKWFNYGIIMLVMILDLNMYKNQIIYEPNMYAQYTHPTTHQVYTVFNTTLVAQVEGGDFTGIDWATRRGMFGDERMQSQFIDASMFKRGITILPILFGFALVVYMYRSANSHTAAVARGDFVAYNRRRNLFHRECLEVYRGRIEAVETVVTAFDEGVDGEINSCSTPHDLAVNDGEAFDLYISVSDIISMDWCSKSDLLVVAFISAEHGASADYYVGQTELIRNRADGTFERPIRVRHRRGHKQEVKLLVCDADSMCVLVNKDGIGEVRVGLDDLVGRGSIGPKQLSNRTDIAKERRLLASMSLLSVRVERSADQTAVMATPLAPKEADAADAGADRGAGNAVSPLKLSSPSQPPTVWGGSFVENDRLLTASAINVVVPIKTADNQK